MLISSQIKHVARRPGADLLLPLPSGGDSIIATIWGRAPAHPLTLMTSPINTRSSGTQEPQLVPACKRYLISSGERGPNSWMA